MKGIIKIDLGGFVRLYLAGFVILVLKETVTRTPERHFISG